ncbi:MAG: GatB/YqeY domain-containing protein [bacterium]|nr:GatB/YqeY domain-containing protein [bacterium]
MSQLDRLKEELISALKEHHSDRLGVLRLLKNSLDIKAKEGTAIDDAVFKAVAQAEVKKRQDAIALYEQAGAKEKADAEQAEIDILQDYLPPALTEAEIEQVVKNTITQTGATTAADMGRVMAALKEPLAGRANMGQVSNLVRQLLA